MKNVDFSDLLKILEQEETNIKQNQEKRGQSQKEIPLALPSLSTNHLQTQEEKISGFIIKEFENL